MTDQEQEVWSVVQALNRSWTSGQPERLTEFFHPRVQALTPTDRAVLQGQVACVAAWKRFAGAVRVLRWTESEPQVCVLGDAAVVSYCYDLLGDVGGRSIRLQGRDLFVLLRSEGRWQAIADAFGEFPQPTVSGASGSEPPACLATAAPETIDRIWRERWGLPIVTLRGSYAPADVEGLFLSRRGEPQGLLTWRQAGSEAELVTLDAFNPGQGDGTRLLLAVEERLLIGGAKTIVLTTTNDNLHAVGFYVRRGYRITRIERDAMREVRRLKPQIPVCGPSGIPIQDMLELEKRP